MGSVQPISVADAVGAPLPVGRPTGIDGILRALRTHLGLEVAFLSRISDGRVFMRNIDTVPGAPIQAGDSFDIGDGYCQRIIDGKIPNLIPDASLVPEVAHLRCTRELPVGSHLSVPLRLSDGSIYGTFCCFGYRPDHTLGSRDLAILQAFAELAAAQLEAELDAAAAREAIEARVRGVVLRDDLTMVYQPVYRLQDRKIIGVEALARFADGESRTPDRWFSEAQEVGLGVELELTAVRAALRGLRYLPRDVRLGVNVSPATILSPHLAALIDDAPPDRLVLELTEHDIVRDYVHLKRSLDPLRGRVQIAVDDAGAGYSGLRHILDIRPDIIKLDLNLTRNVNRDPARAALASALVTFGRAVGAHILAEGVETAGELSALEQLGVHSAQGYYLHRPLPIAAAQFLFAER